MVNLLFISSHSKIDIINNALQPLLNVRIDRVADFDYGLKEVFEKRPALVFIQDQISGVTGESVARHIQMLLGSGAPSFIFMHDGNLKAKPVKGLYDYLIDLSQDDSKVLADIQSALKSLLGAQWHKVYVPPRITKSDVMATLAVPEEHRAHADRLVDDFISDLGGTTHCFSNNSVLPDFSLPESSAEEPFQIVSSTHDQLDEILATAATELMEKDAAEAAVSVSGTQNVSVAQESTLASVSLAPSAASVRLPSTAADVATAASAAAAIFGSPSSARTASPGTESVTAAPIRADMSGKSPSAPLSPADYTIERERRAVEAATLESLRSFESNYLSETATKKWYLTIVVLVALGLLGWGWYLIKQKLHPMKSIVSESPAKSVSAPLVQPVSAVSVAQKAISTARRPETTVLPSFIPLSGYDGSFASQKPGWERYVGTDSEYRVFRQGGKLRAIQVMATQGHMISESRLKKIVTELTGTGEYSIASTENKLGFQVSRATINRKADLLIYRKKTAIHAFVISLD